ncbi:MAG: hypothetical protein RLZZ385_1467 [Pseudomonadota bacterium]
MSDNKQPENDPERTLITLDQLSQTIEVMTSVVNRLRQHLSQQIQARRAEAAEAPDAVELAALEEAGDMCDEIEVTTPATAGKRGPVVNHEEARESFIVEITRHESDQPKPKDDKILH